MRCNEAGVEMVEIQPQIWSPQSLTKLTLEFHKSRKMWKTAWLGIVGKPSEIAGPGVCQDQGQVDCDHSLVEMIVSCMVQRMT